jgi:hypothetical protein
VRRKLERSLQRLAPLLLLLLLELLRLLSAVLLLQLPPRLLLALLLFFLLLLLEGAKPGRPGRPSRNKRSLSLLIHRKGIRRGPITAGPITYGNGIPLDPRSGRLGGSFLPLGPGRLGLFWRRRGRITRQGTRWGALGAGRQLRFGGACKTKNKGQSL